MTLIRPAPHRNICSAELVDTAWRREARFADLSRSHGRGSVPRKNVTRVGVILDRPLWIESVVEAKIGANGVAHQQGFGGLFDTIRGVYPDCHVAPVSRLKLTDSVIDVKSPP